MYTSTISSSKGKDFKVFTFAPVFFFLLFIYTLNGTAQSGLNSAQAVGKFLNGSLPTLTPGDGGNITWGVEPAFPNLRFQDPLVITPHPSENRLFVASRQGLIEHFINTPNVSTKQVLVDLRDDVGVIWDGGFLGFAFHPEFGQAGSPNRNYFYVYFTAKGPNGENGPFSCSSTCFSCPDNANFFGAYLRLSRFEVNEGTLTVNPNSELRMINVRAFNGTHRGGGLVFGDDGFLYLTIGDQARYLLAQNIVDNFEGGVIRIDVDQRGGNISHAPRRRMGVHTGESDEYTGVGYYVPNNNPFLDTNNGLFEEFVSLGHRAPHRMTKDRVTGEMWIGEVGGGSREEISILQVGGNGGWPIYEGNNFRNVGSCGSNSLALGLGTYNPPVVDFQRNEANAIIGGYVYRGSRYPSLYGKYICGGYSQNRMFVIERNGSKSVLTSFTPGGLITFGEDQNGELYMGRQNGNTTLYTLQGTGGNPPAPQFLSQIDAFKNLNTLEPQDGVIPYDMIEDFWSDGADKDRWLAIPNDGSHNTASEKIQFSENGNWIMPRGAVLIKHFELGGKRLETRFEVKGDDDQYYYLTYKWNAAGTDAELLPGALDETVTVNGQSQVWHYPSRSECLNCHQQEAGSILGPKTRYLNRSITYPTTGITANQLVTLSSIGILDQSISNAQAANFLTMAAYNDPNASLEFRARSYIDLNCSYCHQPAITNRAQFDARLTTPLAQQNLIYGPIISPLDLTDPWTIVPQNTSRSMIHHRMNSTANGVAMPPLAKNEIDQPGVQLIADWINSLPPSNPPSALGQGTGLAGTYFNNIDLTNQALQRIDPTVNFNWGGGSPDPSIGADTYSVRWDGFVEAPSSGEYTFYTNSDDGVRLWVDNQLIIDNWTDHGPTEDVATLGMGIGQLVPIRLEWYENGGGAVIQLSWSGPGVSKQIIPQSYLYPEELNCNAGVVTNTIVNTGFDSNTGGFSYVDDVFANTNQPNYASGQRVTSGGRSGAALKVNVGGVDNSSIQNMSGGWRYTFSLSQPADVSLSFWYNMIHNEGYESDEYSQVLVSLNGTQQGGTIAQLTGDGNGGGNQSTGWQQATLNLGSLSSGSHSVVIGGFNNKKTISSELTEIFFDDVEITRSQAGSIAPIASFSATPTSGTVPLLVSFNGNGSSDPEGRNLTYAWNFGDGVTASGPTPSHTYSTVGSFVATLTVTNSLGCEGSSTQTITVSPVPNQAPIASFTADPTSGNAPLLVNFNASGSSDPDNDPLTYSWNFGDGGSGTGLSPSHTFQTEGTFTVTLTVNDGDLSATSSTTITVSPEPNRAPVADFTATPTSGNAPLVVNFDASPSSDPDNDPLTYSWEFGDGESGTGLNPSHTYQSLGTYTARLTVSDTELSSTKTLGITVSQAPDTESPSVPLNLIASNLTTTTVDLSWNASTDNVGVIAYLIYQNGNSNPIQMQAGTSYTVTGLSPNTTYQFAVAATDAAGNISAQSQAVQVQTLSEGGGECTTPSNLALGGTASQSSTYGAGSATLAVDGVTTGSSPWTPDLQHTQSENQPWWEVDLGQLSDLQTVRIYNRSGSNQERLKDFYVLFSAAPFSPTATLSELVSSNSVNQVFYPGEAGNLVEFNVDERVRFVRIQLTQAGILHMAEVELLGCPSADDPCAGAQPVGIDPAGPFAENAGLQTLSANPVGGTWGGAAASNGTFDPSVGPGDYTISYTYTNGNGCTQTATETVTVSPVGTCNTASNLAANGTAIQSSTYGNGGASLAIDGSTTGSSPWTADLQHTTNEAQPWWEVDLGSFSQIDLVKIFNRSDCCQERLANFYVLVSSATMASVPDLNSLLNSSGVESFYVSSAIGAQGDIPINTEGRFVRIQLVDQGILHMAEVEVMGCSSGSDPCAGAQPVSITPAGPFAEDVGIQSLAASPIGGTWGGDANANGTFDPSQGPGTYTVSYTYTDGNGCTQSASSSVTVIPSGSSCTNPTNLALNQPTEQSTLYGLGISSIGVDGDIDGTRGPWSNASLIHTAREDQPWWQVSLPSLSEIQEVVLYNRTDCCQSRLTNFYVLISDTPFPNGASLDQLLTNPTIQPFLFDGNAGNVENIPINSTGQYVRIQLSSTSEILHFAEVEVMACASSSSRLAMVGQEEESPEWSVEVYPNPADSRLFIDLIPSASSTSWDIQVYDLTGRQVDAFSAQPGKNIWQVGGLSKGIYTLRIKGQDRSEVKRILVD
ncbi:MAG: PKD domain-containing protein [Bacteroidota bacterium]